MCTSFSSTTSSSSSSSTQNSTCIPTYHTSASAIQKCYEKQINEIDQKKGINVTIARHVWNENRIHMKHIYIVNKPLPKHKHKQKHHNKSKFYVGVCWKEDYNFLWSYNKEDIGKMIAIIYYGVYQCDCKKIVMVPTPFSHYRKKNVFNVDEKMCQYCADKKVFDQLFHAPTNFCSICQDTSSPSFMIQLPCDHWFHCKCIKNDKSKKCPNCRSLFNLNSLMEEQVDYEEENEQEENKYGEDDDDDDDDDEDEDDDDDDDDDDENNNDENNNDENNENNNDEDDENNEHNNDDENFSHYHSHYCPGREENRETRETLHSPYFLECDDE